MEKYGMGFVAFSPLAQGKLLDKFSPESLKFEPGDNRLSHADFSAEAIVRLKPKIEILKKRFGATMEDLAAMAQHYVLAQPHVLCTIPGFKNERQARCNIAGADRTFSKDDIRFIRETLAPLAKP
jgi:aryl-alcohol dehydrogenase-like predicted oxidoreductase